MHACQVRFQLRSMTSSTGLQLILAMHGRTWIVRRDQLVLDLAVAITAFDGGSHTRRIRFARFCVDALASRLDKLGTMTVCARLTDFRSGSPKTVLGPMQIQELATGRIAAVAVMAGNSFVPMHVAGQVIGGDEQPCLISLPQIRFVMALSAHVLLEGQIRTGKRLRVPPTGQKRQETQNQAGPKQSRHDRLVSCAF